MYYHPMDTHSHGHTASNAHGLHEQLQHKSYHRKRSTVRESTSSNPGVRIWLLLHRISNRMDHLAYAHTASMIGCLHGLQIDWYFHPTGIHAHAHTANNLKPRPQQHQGRYQLPIDIRVHMHTASNANDHL
jgi:hypothetical protein